VRRSTGKSDEPANSDVGYRIAVVGTSWGGLAALRALVAALPADLSLPLAIVQHRHRDSDAMLARFLQGLTSLRVCEVEDKQPVEGGRIFVAPANYHMLVEHGHFSLSLEAPVRYSRPSIDVAMTTAADAFGHRAVGVVLTGGNADGAEGLQRIASSGGMAVVQDPDSAEVRAMPEAALAAVPTARVFSLARIGAFLASLPVATPAGQEGAP
jgi:two-component system, chemotaxis family, protein-glutamate methylesterase/glutaminase